MRSEEQVRFRLNQLIRRKKEREEKMLDDCTTWASDESKENKELALKIANQMTAMLSRNMEMPEDKEIEILRWVLQE